MPSVANPSVLILSVLYLALLLLIGYTVLCTATGPAVRHWLELLGLSFALGCGTVSIVLFVTSITGIKPSRPVLIAMAGAALAGLMLQIKNKRLIAPSVPSRRGKFDALTLLGIGGLGLIVAAAGNVAARASWPGLNDMDAFAIWMFKAKVLALSALRPLPVAFSVPTLSYSHQDYPLSLPLLVSGLYAAIGHLNDEQAKIFLLPIYLSLIAILYSAIRRRHRRATSLAVTAIFAASPTLTQNAAVLVAETPLLLAWTGAMVMLLRWIETRDRGDLIVCGLFAAFTAFTKNEGLALMPVLGIITLILAWRSPKPGAIKDWILAAAVSTASLTPWLIYRTFLPKTHEDYGSKLTHASMLLHNLDRLGYVLPQFFGRLFDGSEIGVIWCLLIFIALLGYRGFARPGIIVLWIVLLIQLALYTATFVVTPWDVHILVPLIGPKLLTQASPIAALLIAQHLQELRWPRQRPAQGRLDSAFS